MRSRRVEPLYYSRSRDELLFSGTAIAELLKAVMERGKAFKFKARGWSMSPFIRNGDILTLSPACIPFPKKGDVVGVIDPGTEKLMIHRVVGMKNGRYWIKGDSAKKKRSGSFEMGNICGHVTRVERNGKPVRFGLGPERRVIAVLSRIPFVMRMVSKVLGLINKFRD